MDMLAASLHACRQMRRWDNSVLELVQQRSALQQFLIWIGTVLLCGVAYWLAALAGKHGLVEAGSPVGVNLKGLTSAVYFSFITATTIGYGDIVPVGIARWIAVAEAVTALLIFGAVVAKFVSHRQEELTSEIQRVTFEERLDRVQTNLHMVISELLSITAMCEAQAPLNGIGTRLDSSALIFLGEMRSIHDLLYQPRLVVEEGVLGSILAHLASALTVMSELLAAFAARVCALAAAGDCARKPDAPCRGHLQQLRPPQLHTQARILDGPHSGNGANDQVRTSRASDCSVPLARVHRSWPHDVALCSAVSDSMAKSGVASKGPGSPRRGETSALKTYRGRAGSRCSQAAEHDVTNIV